MLRFAVILAVASTVVSPADAFTPTADQKACATLPANADVVAACTRIIEAPSSSTLDRAASYTFRADALAPTVMRPRQSPITTRRWR